MPVAWKQRRPRSCQAWLFFLAGNSRGPPARFGPLGCGPRSERESTTDKEKGKKTNGAREAPDHQPAACGLAQPGLCRSMGLMARDRISVTRITASVSSYDD
ncbi:hypothetical protein H0G86_001484 [Trichoderma simmonsii]|uniref:Uncharacterized protein n=1 Tax=Trichoderma simmonsii TaxID=1491479 RepID=A0A8G0L6K3_9HYPO|nr:hypothetical protein H0G86_001484 [Trichoderma simmonsii]